MNRGNQLKQMFLSQSRMLLREKQVWFWGIFFPVILMVIFMVIFSDGSDDEFRVKVVLAEKEGAESAALRERIKHIPVFEFVEADPVPVEKAENMVKEKEAAAAIVLSGEGEPVTLIVNKENERSTSSMTVQGILNQLVQQVNLEAAGASPVYQVQTMSVSSGEDDLDYQDFLLTGMIALSIAQGGMFGMVDFVEMRRKGLLKRLRMTPAKMGLFGFSDMLVRFIFSVFQIILLSLIGVFFFGATLHVEPVSLIIIFVIGIMAFHAIGYFFSSFSKTSEAFFGVANIVNFLMMFLSGVFFPIESMPGWLQPVSDILPLTYFVNGLRDSMVYAQGVATLPFWIGIGVLVVWGAAAFALGTLLYRNNRSIAAR